jgi:ribonuclease T2
MSRIAIVALLSSMLFAAGCNSSQNAPSQSSSTAIPGANTPAAATPATITADSDTHSHRRGSRAASSTPGVFDFYLLTLSWSPEYCFSHPTDVQCAAKPLFVLHGLWPENSDGTYPEDCSNAAGPANPSQYSDIYPDASLLQHEWKTHGTCSGLAPDAYFQLERKAFQSIKTSKQLNVTKQISLTPGQILTDEAQANPGIPTSDMALTCGSNFLTAVQVCMTKNLQAMSCSSVKTCGATSVKVTPPGATKN